MENTKKYYEDLKQRSSKEKEMKFDNLKQEKKIEL